MRCTCGSSRQRGSRAVQHGAAGLQHIGMARRSRARARPTARPAAWSAPRRCSRASVSYMLSTTAGARPRLGSSSSSMLRVAHQRAPDGQHLALAARQRAGALAAPLGQAREQGEDAVEQLRRCVRDRRAPSRRAADSARPSGWRTGASPPATAPARGATIAWAGWPADRRALPERSLPAAVGTSPAMALSVVVLPGAVRADQRDHAALRHLQRHVGDADQVAVAHREVADHQRVSLIDAAHAGVMLWPR